jgi:hypothetical protein
MNHTRELCHNTYIIFPFHFNNAICFWSPLAQSLLVLGPFGTHDKILSFPNRVCVWKWYCLLDGKGELRSVGVVYIFIDENEVFCMRSAIGRREVSYLCISHNTLPTWQERRKCKILSIIKLSSVSLACGNTTF